VRVTEFHETIRRLTSGEGYIMKRLMILSGPNLNLLGVSKISSVASGVICGFIAAMHALARMAKKS
jgi:hypothetical protein